MIKEYKINNVDIKDTNTDREIKNRFGNIYKNRGYWKNDSSRYFKIYFCFNYALKNKRLETIEDSFNFIENNYYRIPFKKVLPGDIVLFYEEMAGYNGGFKVNNELYILHLARIVKIDKTINDTIVRGKFGNLGIYEHRLGDTPSEYGNIVEFWREK